MAKIDPGMCPICGNPICTNVPITCSEVCIHSLKKSCYQLGENCGTCECSYDDIMETLDIYGPHLNYDGKGQMLVKFLIEKSSNLMLPEDLFEI